MRMLHASATDRPVQIQTEQIQLLCLKVFVATQALVWIQRFFLKVSACGV